MFSPIFVPFHNKPDKMKQKVQILAVFNARHAAVDATTKQLASNRQDALAHAVCD